jgi:hypothetical protein
VSVGIYNDPGPDHIAHGSESGWMSWTVGQMDGWTDGRTDGRTQERPERWTENRPEHQLEKCPERNQPEE